jgi:hypothetical protein
MTTRTITVEIYDDYGDEIEHELPAIYKVCPDCEGEGSVLHEAIRTHAYTADDWAQEDDEFREEYMRGGKGIYGVQCPTCSGDRVTLAVDDETLSPEQRETFKLWQEQERERAQSEADDRRCRQMESGEY